jgi:hypothetical protein
MNALLLGAATATACLASLVCLACQSEDTKRCLSLMASAQEIVKKVDAKDLASVEESLAAVEGARGACDKAGRTGERDELTKARNELAGHADFMKQKAARPLARKKRTPEELAEIALHGDPNCPKGQAYKEEGSNKEIRCSGPQPADMGFAKADDYFRGRGYKITTSDSPPTLKAEYGAELYVYTYATPKDEHPPRCLTVYPVPGTGWEEAAGRATGAPLRHLEKDKTTVETGHGKVPLRIEESESKLVVHIGDCG